MFLLEVKEINPFNLQERPSTRLERKQNKNYRTKYSKQQSDVIVLSFEWSRARVASTYINTSLYRKEAIPYKKNPAGLASLHESHRCFINSEG